ncbi:AbfB domain-containing protein [Streptomyces sp. SID13726]|uniref:AbfB domain-containing protein n=1 Tax=Streptomyces sp. SID13726 TaxID=2706058 RepID=UPI0013B780C3|nr:AbfB domain-containing protein [Streptomyces sp. SID13726]NEB01445.1 alpha-L-arabinofuranosidase [Streptomyces sp. SID13726]
MPEDKSRPPQDRPWENGWKLDTSRTPGTRRLYLAGVLAVATIIACVAAIAATDNEVDAPSKTAKDEGSGLISFSSQPATTLPPEGESGLSPVSPTAGAPRQQGSTPTARVTASPKPPRSTPTKGTSPKPKPKPSATYRSVRSVNYPDRYWHVNDGYVALDPVRGSESREDSTFKQVKGLANSSCYSFTTHDGKYLRHRNFVLRADRNDGSSLFKQDATFCPRDSSYYSGAKMLESVNYPGYFLRHKNFVVRLERFEYSSLYLQDSSFRLVDGLA